MLVPRIKFFLFVDALKGDGDITIFFSELEGIAFSTDSIRIKFGQLAENASSFRVSKVKFLEALGRWKKSELPKLLELSVRESSIAPPKFTISDYLTIDLEYSESLWEELDIPVDVEDMVLVTVNQASLKKLAKVNTRINFVGDVFYCNGKEDAYALYVDQFAMDRTDLFGHVGSFNQPEIIALMNLIYKKEDSHKYRFVNGCLILSLDGVTFYFRFNIEPRTSQELDLNEYRLLPTSVHAFLNIYGLDVVQYKVGETPIYISKELYNRAISYLGSILTVGILRGNLALSYGRFTFLAPMLVEEIPKNE